MTVFERRTAMPVSARVLFDWHARAGAFERLNPPFAPAVVEAREGGLEVGARTVLRIPMGPVWSRWVAQHTAYEEGRMFRDEQVSGPFASWVHTHRFEPLPDGTSELVDTIEYQLPLGQVGALAGQGFVERLLDRTFAYRHAVTLLDLTRHAQCAQRPRLVVAVTGASGLIGTALCAFLRAGGHEVRPVRRAGQEIESAALDGAEVVVNLAGAGVADQRWSADRKQLLIDSRVGYTQRLLAALRERGVRPRVLIQGSAVGVYGDRGDEALTERSTVGPAQALSERRGPAFLSQLCLDWEAAGLAAKEMGTRVVLLRTGVVQSAAGGALAKQLPAFRSGVGGPLAGGGSWQPWVSNEDVLGLILWAAYADQFEGPLNAVGPHGVTSATYAQTLGGVLHRPAIAPLPAFALRMLFGELADGALLASQRVVPERAVQAGYTFAHSTLEQALRFTLGRSATGAGASDP